MKVGFIGLGQMGAGMAANLLKAGHEVVVWNRSPERAKPLAEQGARVAASIAEACQAEAVFSMLADDQTVRGVTLGKDGVVGSLTKGAAHISSSTISPALAKELAAAHAAASQEFVSAPVFGRPEMAAAGALFVVAAGPADAVERVSPLLDAIGQKTFVLGEDPSAANLLKLSGNFLIAAAIEAMGEAVALVAKGGIDPKQYVEILTTTLFNAPVYRGYGHLIAHQIFEPAGFAAPLGQKDVRLALEAGAALGVPLPIASLLRDRFLALIAAGGERLDWSAISTLAARDAGLEVPALAAR